MLCGNGDHSANGSTAEKLEEMQGEYRAQNDAYELIRPAIIHGAETLAKTKRQEDGIKVNEMRMLRWIYG